jgi:hypothetical protein
MADQPDLPVAREATDWDIAAPELLLALRKIEAKGAMTRRSG